MKLQFLIVLFYCVYYVLGESSFIPKGQRAEIFELTDNEVPVFKVTLPNDEFNTLKRKASFMDLSTVKDLIQQLNELVIKVVEVVNRQDFNKVFPGYDFKEILPELPIDENGHPNIDYKEFLIDFNNILKINVDSMIEFFQSVFNNSYLNLIDVFRTLNNLDISSEADDKTFLAIIHEFGTINENNEDVYQYPENYQDSLSHSPKIDDYFGYNYNYEPFDFDDWNSNMPTGYWDAPTGYWDAPTGYWDAPSGYWDDSPSSTWDYDYDYPSGSVNNEDDDSFYNFIMKYFLNLLNKDNESNDVSSPPEIIDYDENEKFFNDFTTKGFYEHFKNYNFDKEVNFESSFYGEEVDFKTKNATMVVEINKEKKAFKKITFSIGGSYSRSFSKPGYNIKIRGGDELYGRRQFKLRGDASEPSYMRTKLVSDIRNRIGIPSLSANYATLYVNDEYFGLFTFTDMYKESWIEYVYGEKDTQLLYKCSNCDLTYGRRFGFENENKEATNKKELYEFLAAMTKAKSASDVESIFDLDQYYKEIAVDLLVSSWDHTLHNYYVYKNKDKWIYLSHDYDLDMGMSGAGPSLRINSSEYSINPIIKKFIINDDHQFREVLKEIVANVFNPATLYPHIDEIKSFIRPYVKLDKTPDENGQYPGRINLIGDDNYTFEDWENSVEFKSVPHNYYEDYALKKFILLKYRIVCQDYDLECDPVYLDKHYGQSLNANSTITDNDESVDVTVNDNKKELVDIEDLENNDIIDTTDVADNEEYEIDDEVISDIADEPSESSSSDEEEEDTSDYPTSF